MTNFLNPEKNESCDTLILDDRFAQLWRMVGSTPMIKLCYRHKGKNSFIFVKCEQYNLTGSIKDRLALYILQQSYKKGCLFPGHQIVEATSGNTGLSFAAIGKALGHRVKIIMPAWVSQERQEHIRSLGADVILVSREQGGFFGCLQKAESISNVDRTVFLPRQFENPLNIEAHEMTTGPEMLNQLHHYRFQPDAFVAGVGTGGTLMGVAKSFKQQNKHIKIYPLETAENPNLTMGIEGFSEDFIPPMVRLQDTDKVIHAHDGDAILMARKIAGQLGLSVGISSGANVIGAIKVKEEMVAAACVITVFPDGNKRYSGSALAYEEPRQEHYITPYIDFIGYQPLER